MRLAGNCAGLWYTIDVRVFSIALLLALCLCGITPARAVQWSASRVPGAMIYVRAGDTALAREIGAMAKGEIPALAQIIGVKTPGVFPIFAFTNWPDFLRATGFNPDLLGESISPSGTIMIYVTGDDYSVQRTLAHELTHSLLGQRLGRHIGNLPTWVNEGLACHLSDPHTSAELAGISRQPHHAGLLSLEQLDQAFVVPGSHDVAYWQSRSMVAWLEYHYPGSLRRFIDNLAAGETFESALYHATSLTPDDWWHGWEGGIPAYIYVFTVLSPQAIFTLMAVLVLLAALLRALRKRRETKDDEEEEEEESTATNTAASHTSTAQAGERTAGKYDIGQNNDDLLEDQ